MSERVQEDVKSALASLDRHLEGASPLFVESFKTTFVFDVSQTEPLPGADPAPLEAATPAADWRLAHRRGL